MFDLLKSEKNLIHADCVHENCQQMNVYCPCEEILVWFSLSSEADLQWTKNLQKFEMAEKSFMGFVI